jgi:acetyl esterase
MPNDVAIAATHEVETRDLEYRRSEDGPLLARLYKPKGNGPFPALIEVHGGAWESGDRLNNAPLDEALAKSGIVVLAIDFRMPPKHRYPASIADIHYATRWLKAHAGEFGSRADLVAGLGTSSGAHQLLLSALKPRDPRYAALPVDGAVGIDASLPYLVLCWPISDPLARYRMVKEKGRTPLIQSHDAYWNSEAEMAEGNPQRIVEAGEAASLPPAILLQGTADDNVTPDMADKFTAAWRAKGGSIDCTHSTASRIPL